LSFGRKGHKLICVPVHWWIRTYARLALAQTAAAIILLLATPVWADDCSRDYKRAEDCMRTPGFAQGLGTTAGVIATVLINGAAITTLVFAPKPAPGVQQKEGEAPPPPRQFNFQVTVQDNEAKQRMVFYGDAEDRLYITSWVEEITDKGTVNTGQVVGFQLASGHSWVKLTAVESGAATVYALERLAPGPIPEEAYLDPPRVLLHASLGGNPATIPVDVQVRRFRGVVNGPEAPIVVPDSDDPE
jgi:hypothetical protein